ncbi:hypothetical protein ACNDVF_004997 [Escherichia coli]
MLIFTKRTLVQVVGIAFIFGSLSGCDKPTTNEVNTTETQEGYTMKPGTIERPESGKRKW